jgi:hypothetical protein
MDVAWFYAWSAKCIPALSTRESIPLIRRCCRFHSQLPIICADLMGLLSVLGEPQRRHEGGSILLIKSLDLRSFASRCRTLLGRPRSPHWQESDLARGSLHISPRNLLLAMFPMTVKGVSGRELRICKFCMFPLSSSHRRGSFALCTDAKASRSTEPRWFDS